MRFLTCVAVLACCRTADVKLGKPLTPKDPVPMGVDLSDPDRFVGKTIVRSSETIYQLQGTGAILLD